jgi:phosphinothricin acetyltransferase
MKIEPATLTDWPAIAQIYREGIRTGQATFEPEENIPDGPTWFAGKIPGLIFQTTDDHGRMHGWAALSAVSSRCVYRGVAEVSVYVAANTRGQGIGKALLAHLVHASEEAGLWTLQASIFPENIASIQLHQQAGFRLVGIREKLGQMNGRWRDVAFLERRSVIIM